MGFLQGTAILKREADSAVRLRVYVLASLFAGLTAVGAALRIPLPYVPITLQTAFVLLSGLLLGPRYGALSQMLYVLVGLLGAPIFAHGGGPAYILQPTFGYLLSFPLTAYVVGRLVSRRWAKSRPRLPFLILVGAVGVLINLTLGAAVLALNLAFVQGHPIGLRTLLSSYFLVFLPGDLVKIAVCAGVADRVYAWTNGFVTARNGCEHG